MRRLLLVVAVVVVGVGLVLVGSGGTSTGRGTPSSGSIPTPAAAPVYLALGDSVAAGVGATPLEGDVVGAVRRWRSDGYAGLFATVLTEELDCPPGGDLGCPGLEYVNEAEPGATTASFLAGQMPAATALLRERNAGDDPRDDVRVVTLTLGGNDVFGPVIGACLTGRGIGTDACLDTVGQGLTTFAANYGRVLADLRAAAGPDTGIVVTTYYNPMDACRLGRSRAEAPALADAVLEGAELPGLPPEGMNDIIRATAAEHGAVVADAYGALESPGDYVGGEDCLHPDADGHRALAEVVAEAWRSTRTD